jgi:hypothetical protein
VHWASGLPCALMVFEGHAYGIPRAIPAARMLFRVFPLSSPAKSGRSSTPRPIGSSSGVSGILGRPVPPSPKASAGPRAQGRRSFSEGGKPGDDIRWLRFLKTASGISLSGRAQNQNVSKMSECMTFIIEE